MAKYDALREHLRLDGRNTITLSFAQIDAIVPDRLPDSARIYGAWWAPFDGSPSHVQAEAWEAAGYRVDKYDLHAKTVTFTRKGR